MKLESASFLRPIRADFSFLPTGGAASPARITASNVSAPELDASFGAPCRLVVSYELGSYLLPLLLEGRVSAGDFLGKALSRPVYSQEVLAADAATFGSGKAVVDGLALPAAGELVYKVLTRTHIETLNAADAGLAVSQSYTSGTYFSEDYVGSSRVL